MNQSREAHRWDQVADKPALLPMTVEETLRFDPSVPVWRRVTTRPVTLGGVALPKGAKLFLWLAAAGRDPRVFPERIASTWRGPTPTSTRHSAGAPLLPGRQSRQAGGTARLEELASRFPCLRLVEGQQLSFHPNISFRGPQSLRVRPG